jgi:hypothetical protein
MRIHSLLSSIFRRGTAIADSAVRLLNNVWHNVFFNARRAASGQAFTILCYFSETRDSGTAGEAEQRDAGHHRTCEEARQDRNAAFANDAKQLPPGAARDTASKHGRPESTQISQNGLPGPVLSLPWD